MPDGALAASCLGMACPALGGPVCAACRGDRGLRGRVQLGSTSCRPAVAQPACCWVQQWPVLRLPPAELVVRTMEHAGRESS